MTASDPRVGEIAARLAEVTPGPWYVDDEEQTVRAREYAGEIVYDRSGEHPSEWTRNFKPTAEFIAAAPADIAYLLAELQKRDDALARVEAQCAAAHEMASYVVGEDVQEALKMCARGIRAAVTAAKGDGE